MSDLIVFDKRDRHALDARLAEVAGQYDLRRFHALEERERRQRAALLDARDQNNEVRRQIARLEGDLRSMRTHYPHERDRGIAERELLDRIETLRAENGRLKAAAAEISSRLAALTTLVNNCREYLHKQGALGSWTERSRALHALNQEVTQ